MLFKTENQKPGLLEVMIVLQHLIEGIGLFMRRRKGCHEYATISVISMPLSSCYFDQVTSNLGSYI